MELYYTATSPYSRKVRLLIQEKGLQERVTEVVQNPLKNEQAILSANPLGKIPVLILDEGHALYDSRVICQYLNGLIQAPDLIQSENGEVWPVLRGEALADGIMDATFLSVMELKRSESERSAFWLERWRRQIKSALDEVEKQIPQHGGDPTLATLAFASALVYLDLRLADLDWRQDRPLVTAWYDDFSTRPSMKATA